MPDALRPRRGPARAPSDALQDPPDPSLSPAVSNPLMSSRDAPSRNTSTETRSAKSVSEMYDRTRRPVACSTIAST